MAMQLRSLRSPLKRWGARPSEGRRAIPGHLHPRNDACSDNLPALAPRGMLSPLPPFVVRFGSQQAPTCW